MKIIKKKLFSVNTDVSNYGLTDGHLICNMSVQKTFKSPLWDFFEQTRVLPPTEWRCFIALKPDKCFGIWMNFLSCNTIAKPCFWTFCAHQHFWKLQCYEWFIVSSYVVIQNRTKHSFIKSLSLLNVSLSHYYHILSQCINKWKCTL